VAIGRISPGLERMLEVTFRIEMRVLLPPADIIVGGTPSCRRQTLTSDFKFVR
jgi:hypothetical protein